MLTRIILFSLFLSVVFQTRLVPTDDGTPVPDGPPPPIDLEYSDGDHDMKQYEVTTSSKFLALPFTDRSVQITQGWLCHFGSDICGLYVPYGAHHAIDYAKFSGNTPVSFKLVATAPGVAQCYLQNTHPSLSWHYGNIVQIDHTGFGSGYSSIYAHVSSCEFTSKSVHRGEQVGWAGTSGNSTGIHLHFELRGASFARVDPYDLWTTIYSYPQPGQSGVQAGSNHFWTDNPPRYANLTSDYNNDWKPDLWAINGQGSDSTELHVVSGSIPEQFLLHSSTALHKTGGNWCFSVADYNKDYVPDLWAVNKQGTSSTEIHVISGANPSQFLLHSSTALHQTGDNWVFLAGDYDGAGIPDLWAVNKQGTSSTEIHVISGANPSQFLLHSSTALHQTGDNWVFALEKYDSDDIPDLWAINKQGDSSTEIHVISGANPSQFLLHSSTALHQTGDNWSFFVADYNDDGIPDLWAINKQGDSSTEIHVISGANPSQFLLHSSTALHQTGDNWVFGDGTCFESSPPPSEEYNLYLPVVGTS